MPSSPSRSTRHPSSSSLPYTTLFRSYRSGAGDQLRPPRRHHRAVAGHLGARHLSGGRPARFDLARAYRAHRRPGALRHRPPGPGDAADRKSTRLNSSHLVISYAVFSFKIHAAPELVLLALHDALPILPIRRRRPASPTSTPPPCCRGPSRSSASIRRSTRSIRPRACLPRAPSARSITTPPAGSRRRCRSEEHTSELQSPCNLVCRLLLQDPRGTRARPPCPTRRSSDLTDPAPATSFAHLDATTVLSRAISELGIYPAVDPLDSTSRVLTARTVGQEHYDTARRVQETLQIGRAHV